MKIKVFTLLDGGWLVASYQDKWRVEDVRIIAAARACCAGSVKTIGIPVNFLWIDIEK